MASNLRYEIAFERYDDGIGDYVTDPYPVLFGTREEAEAHKVKLIAGLDVSYFPADAEPADLWVFEMVIKGNSVERTGA